MRALRISLYIGICLQLFTPLMAQHLKKLTILKNKAFNYLYTQYQLDNFPSYNMRLLWKFCHHFYQDTHHPLPENLLNFQPIYKEDSPVVKFYQPLVNPNFATDTLSLISYFHSTTPIEQAMLWGIYPQMLTWNDKVQKVWQEIIEMEDFSAKDVRDLAHLLLPYFWIKRYWKTAHPKLKELEKDFPVLKAKLLKSLHSIGIATDTGMEGLLALCFMNYHNAIPKEWLSMLLRHQQKDGGFKLDTGAKESNVHTTLLAYWIALELLAKQYNSKFNR